MEVIGDLHIHSKYARACSKDLNLENLEKWARIKGINLLGTGDFQHPKWIEELKGNLVDDGSGILKSKSGFPFVLQTEISLMYTQDGKGRRVHNLILAPNLEVANQIIDELGSRGRLDYDGRPIFNFSCVELVEMMMKVSKDIEIIPAHAWTPWFSMFGSMSGFDSMKDCFKEHFKDVHAIETGLSSDPEMNWRISELDDKSVLSFSDAHSFWPFRLGREATVFEVKNLSYKELIKAIRENKVKETIEVDPAYGKYHWDGHRNCNVVLDPEKVKDNKLCPICKTQLTIGVQHRVNELADRELGFKPKNAKPFRRILPLSEMIGLSYNISQLWGKKVFATYYKLIEQFGNEFNVLLNADEEEIKKSVGENLANLIIKNRNGQIKVEPGYDGVYGKPILERMMVKKGQKTLGDY